MNDKELKHKVNAAMYKLMKEKGVASPVEVLLELGVLSKNIYEDWRRGRVPYLERVCQINLGKLSTINSEIRAFAKKNNLKPSWAAYQKWGNGKSIRLRFSKSGVENIERSYATHYVSQQKVDDAHKRKDDLAMTIAPCGNICGLCCDFITCKGCREEDSRYAHVHVCHNRQCCADKGIKGCWKCPDFPCGRGIFSSEHGVRYIAFVRCAKEDGPKALAGYMLRNQDNGVLYHRDKQKHTGDYDGLGGEEAVLALLRKGNDP